MLYHDEKVAFPSKQHVTTCSVNVKPQCFNDVKLVRTNHVPPLVLLVPHHVLHPRTRSCLTCNPSIRKPPQPLLCPSPPGDRCHRGRCPRGRATTVTGWSGCASSVCWWPRWSWRFTWSTCPMRSVSRLQIWAKIRWNDWGQNTRTSHSCRGILEWSVK